MERQNHTMANDATFEIMAGIGDKIPAVISLLSAPVYNIDDMDPKFCMVDLRLTGCFCLRPDKAVDPTRPGMVFINDQPTEPPLTMSKLPMFGQMIGIRCRRWLREYDRDYDICYAGAYDADGMPIPEFRFTLHTAPRCEPGEQYPEHDAIVLQAAREGAVLLKNDNGVLPLGKNATVNAFGAAASVFRSGCLGAGKINPRYSIRVKEGIEKYTSMQLNQELYAFYEQETNDLPGEELLGRAKERSDTAVIFISRCSSEAQDNLPEKGGYRLTDDERSLIRGVAERFLRTVAVLNVAYPIETDWIEEYGVDAVLFTGLSGMAGGRALAEILEGTVTPSGKLPCTWARDYLDYPSAENFLTQQDIKARYGGRDIRFLSTAYEEGLYVGYRYFNTFGKEAAYLFGHGLSYTTFEKTIVRAEVTESAAVLEVRVTNTGTVSGKEVVQIYAHIPCGMLEQPDRRLISFGKTKELAPGESQTVTLEIDRERLKSYDEKTAAWIIEAGKIDLLLGDAPDRAIPAITWKFPELFVISRVKNRVCCPVSLTELSRLDPAGTYPTGRFTEGHTAEKLPHSAPRESAADEEPLACRPEKIITFPEVAADPALAEAFIAQMTDRELARLSMCARTGWGPEDSGFAGTLYRGGALEKYQIPEYYFSDGNNGCNMNMPNIGFPVSAVMCATWNEELLFREGQAIAKEAADMEIHCLLAPALNLQRNPLCGRHAEYFSEDPLLAGLMAGWQSRGIESMGIASCMKHFIANNAETMRNFNHSLMTERTARELYIRAFEVAFGVNMPCAVMTGYNAANGSYCSDDAELLQGILREELEFDGYVMTDWGGYGDKGMPGLLAAGVSWVAPGSNDDTYVTPIAEALASGELSRGRVQDNLVRMVKGLVRFPNSAG